MIPVLLLSACVLTGEGMDVPADKDFAAYKEAAAKVGRDAESHVKLALWCERHGLESERLRHLTAALLTDPLNATARGLLGFASFSGRWMKPEAVADKVKADADLNARLAEYNGLRSKARNTADSQWALGVWCERHGLQAEATAHFSAVTRLDPKREAAWKRLGYKQHNGRWMTEDDIRAEKAESAARREADVRWRRQLEAWKNALDKPSKRAEAEQALVVVNDPRAVSAIWSVFVRNGGKSGQMRAVQLLGQIESPAASRALASLAVTSSSADVRRAATETLKRRDPREFLTSLIARLRDPIKYEVRPVAGPGSMGILFVKGQRFNMRMLYAPPPAPMIAFQPGDTLELDPFGLPMIEKHRLVQRTTRDAKGTYQITETENIDIPVGEMMLEARKSAFVAQKQLESDIATIEAANRKTGEENDRIGAVLAAVTGQDKGRDRETWQAWWTDQLGYAYVAPKEVERPTLTQNVPLAYTPQPIPSTISTTPFGVQFTANPPPPPPGTHHSCFGAGTPVRTMSGPRAIETIQVGDLVLTQDTTTGLLSYQPVLAIFHNRPSETLRVRLGDDTLIVTGIHRLWKTGHGWAMARELKPGDRMRTIGGIARVEAVDVATTQPVFNLEVASGHSFFVGDRGLLAHDNTLVEPTPHPFDAEPALASVSGNAATRP